MKYDALSLDTQTVERNGFNFDGGLLAQLKQFVDGPTTVVITQIVILEVFRHLREKTKEALENVEKAHKKAILYGLRAPAEVAFSEEPDARSVARNRLFTYLSDIGAKVIKPDDVPMKELVSAYFNAAPPFTGSGSKKNEFPDAIALLSLEHWAKSNNKRILAVSGDTDWSTFAKESHHVDVVADLPLALKLLQDDIDQANDIAQRLLEDIKIGKTASLAEQFERYLSDAIEVADVTAEANSRYHYETDEITLTLGDYEIDGGEGSYPVEVVQVGRELIVVAFELRATVAAAATFSLEGWDSEDKEAFDIGSTTATREHEEIDIRVLVTFEGDFSTDRVEITSVEIINSLRTIYFGEIEPDYGEPDYDDLSEVEEASANAGDEADHEEPF